jgi:hypothetical protein
VVPMSSPTINSPCFPMCLLLLFFSGSRLKLCLPPWQACLKT